MSTMVKYSTICKYHGKFIPANEPFLVDDEDVEELKEHGFEVIRKIRGSGRQLSKLADIEPDKIEDIE